MPLGSLGAMMIESNETLEYLQTLARFPFAFRRFLKHRLTLDEAKHIVRERMEQRAENFLRIVEQSVYDYPRSPYLPLLKMAGCELGDLRALVKQKGLKGALNDLREEGVYVTFEEFKGRKPIVRNGTTIRVTARDFDNPFAQRNFVAFTGGSTGAALNIGVNLDHLAALAPHEILTQEAWEIIDVPSVIWRGILPDSTLKILLQTACLRNQPNRWFSHIGWRDSKQWIKYTLATYYVVTWMKALGVPMPFPEYATTAQAALVLQAIVPILNQRQRILVRTSVSRGVRLCDEAEKAGIALNGVIIRDVGEPATPAKIRAIERTNARLLINYSLTEAGALGNGCNDLKATDDVHLFTDTFALIAFPYRVEKSDDLVSAFNLTTLLPSAPKVLLNFQMDDYGIIEERACGCALGRCGFTTHLRDIRSYSKLVGEGVTLIGNELLSIIEQDLPARFGGTLFDYQLTEQEDEQGLTRLFLLVHPRLTIPDEQAVVAVMLNALRESSSMADAARTVWQQAQTLQIKRQAPIWTERGKFMSLYLQRK